MNTTIYYFLIYIAEALICIQYTSNIFSDRFSHFKTFIAIFILYSTSVSYTHLRAHET